MTLLKLLSYFLVLCFGIIVIEQVVEAVAPRVRIELSAILYVTLVAFLTMLIIEGLSV